MRVVKLTIGVTAMVALTVLPAYAQHGNSGNHGPSAGATSHGPTSTAPGSSSAHGPSSTTHGDSAKAHGPSTTHGNSGSEHGPSSKSSGDTTTTSGKSAQSGKSTESGKSAKSTKTGSDSTSTGSSSTSSTSTSSTGGTTTTPKIDFTATPVGQKLSRNTALNSKLVTRLQAQGYTGSVYQAAYGFKNLGQFIAATNVSKNLGIPFEQLKVQMTGVKVAADGTVMKAMVDASGKVTLVDPSKTTDPSLSPAATKSLGQSIQTLKSGVDSTTAAQTATKQADAEIAGTSTAASTSPTTTTTSSTTKSSTSPTPTTSTSTTTHRKAVGSSASR